MKLVLPVWSPLLHSFPERPTGELSPVFSMDLAAATRANTHKSLLQNETVTDAVRTILTLLMITSLAFVRKWMRFSSDN
jgi:hypothetical protein